MEFSNQSIGKSVSSPWEIAEIQRRTALAEELTRRGEALALQEKPAEAERILLRALTHYEQLYSETENPLFAQAAGEISESLADLSMQQTSAKCIFPCCMEISARLSDSVPAARAKIGFSVSEYSCS